MITFNIYIYIYICLVQNIYHGENLPQWWAEVLTKRFVWGSSPLNSKKKSPFFSFNRLALTRIDHQYIHGKYHFEVHRCMIFRGYIAEVS